MVLDEVQVFLSCSTRRPRLEEDERRVGDHLHSSAGIQQPPTMATLTTRSQLLHTSKPLASILRTTREDSRSSAWSLTDDDATPWSGKKIDRTNSLWRW